MLSFAGAGLRNERQRDIPNEAWLIYDNSFSFKIATESGGKITNWLVTPISIVEAINI
jgi:hypothetical protein